MTGSAKQSITTRRKVGLLRRFAPRNDDPNFKRDFAIPTSNATSRSRDAKRPSRCFYLSPKEGVGNAGCPLHPQPRVHFALVERTRVNEYTGITRRSRTQWF